MIETFALIAAVWTTLPALLAVIGAFWLAGRIAGRG